MVSFARLVAACLVLATTSATTPTHRVLRQLEAVHHAHGTVAGLSHRVVKLHPTVGDPAKPVVSAEFSTVLNLTLIQQGQFVHDGNQVYTNAKMSFSVAQLAQIIINDAPSPYLPGAYFNMTTLIKNDTAFMIMNDVCRGQPGTTFSNMWDWLADAKYLGTSMVKGQTCDIWNLNVPGHANLTLYSAGDVPVQYDIYLAEGKPFLPGMNTTGPETVIYEFADWDSTTPASGTFDVPVGCSGHPPLCPTGDVQTFQMVVAQPKFSISNYSIVNQDVADWLGDTFFTCYDVSSNHTESDEYSVISLFEIELDTKWGAYSLCNGYPGQCLGFEKYAVGREASFGAAAMGGQCSDNHAIGNWYSMPKGGMCTSPTDVVGKDCSWRVKQRVRTVEISCVFQERGMLSTCKEEKTAPYSKSKAILKAALTADASSGGCPDVPPPSTW